MSQQSLKKYSKISAALKSYFFENLYYHCLSIKQAADKCKINYSTAKIILKDQSQDQKRYIKRLVRKKQKDQKEGMDVIKVCQYQVLSGTETEPKNPLQRIEIISRVGFDFFCSNEKKSAL